MNYTKADLVQSLTQSGFTIRESRLIVNTIFESIVNALKKGENVITPIGDFVLVRNPEKKRLWRFNRIITIHKQRKKVRFKGVSPNDYRIS